MWPIRVDHTHPVSECLGLLQGVKITDNVRAG
jgi:hypothetical protein